MSAYETLKTLAIQTGNISQQDFETLKQHFANEINTPRCRERIKTLADLIAYLQRCDVLSEQDVSVLCAVADYTKSRELQEAISNYKPAKCDDSHINQYAVQRLGCEMQHKVNSKSSHKVMVIVSEDHVTAIHNLISQEIGNYWRRFGRELGLSEAKMDEIELKCPRDLSSRNMHILHMIKAQHGNNLGQYVNVLCEALMNCQRRDLRRRIESLLIK